jgi:hypothetical protein
MRANGTRSYIEDVQNGINIIHRGWALPGGQLPRCMVLNVVRLVRHVIIFRRGGDLLDVDNHVIIAQLHNRTSQRGMISQVCNMAVNYFHGSKQYTELYR